VRDSDGQSYQSAPPEAASGFRFFYVRDIEWLSAESDLKNIDAIKRAVMEGGVLGTALTWSGNFFSSSTGTFYQPPSSAYEPNHAVAIVGWDDKKTTQAPLPGAWLIKNSWGNGWGQNGYFWISYYDKITGRHPEMGAVSFRNVEPMKYDHIYFHDYHGWRDTKGDVTEAFNAFRADGGSNGEELRAVSFYTGSDGVAYAIKVFGTYENGELKDLLSTAGGTISTMGFHTVNLNWPVSLVSGDDFYVYVELSHGGHAFDRTSAVPVLLGGLGKPIVESIARAGESFFRVNGVWKDLTLVNATANFCIKALANRL
jgi:hypothetical protein